MIVVTQTRPQVRAGGQRDLVDVTDDVVRAVAKSGVSEGRVEVFSPGPSTPIVVNERESGLVVDIRNAVDRAAAAPHGYDPGSTWVALPIAGGRLRLGMWQRVMMLELGEPQTRELVVNVVCDDAPARR